MYFKLITYVKLFIFTCDLFSFNLSFVWLNSFTTRTQYSVFWLYDFSKGSCWYTWTETSHSQICHPRAGSTWSFPLFYYLSHPPSRVSSPSGHMTSTFVLIWLTSWCVKKSCCFFSVVFSSFLFVHDDPSSVDLLLYTWCVQFQWSEGPHDTYNFSEVEVRGLKFFQLQKVLRWFEVWGVTEMLSSPESSTVPRPVLTSCVVLTVIDGVDNEEGVTTSERDQVKWLQVGWKKELSSGPWNVKVLSPEFRTQY
jgi:hypothetical protein